MSLCPGCGAGVSKHASNCGECNADLVAARQAQPKVHRVPTRQSAAAVALLLARQEAARLHLEKGPDGEGPEEFIQRVNRAVTQDLADRAARLSGQQHAVGA